MKYRITALFMAVAMLLAALPIPANAATASAAAPCRQGSDIFLFSQDAAAWLDAGLHDGNSFIRNGYTLLYYLLWPGAKLVHVVGSAALFFSNLSFAPDLSKDAWYLKPPPANAAEQLAVLPSERQIAHAALEYYGFVHFGINTFMDAEWGTGREDPALFNPTGLDTDQWAKTMADAGMKGAILTAKHHDGFCLWPTAFSEHSVKNSPYKNGQGDIVKEFADSCRKYGLKFGFYLSPWDMHEPTYGTGEAYDDFYKAQLRELLTGYGEVTFVWLDGANGEGPNGKKQEYDRQSYFDLVRELQPNAVMCVMGPDVAWVGNENGLANGNVSSIKGSAGSLRWAKSECDVSLRPGWFYHEDENPKTLGQLMHIYYNSVGMNCALLLNVPPNKEGLFDQKDVDRLLEFRKEIDRIYASPVVPAIKPEASAILVDDASSYAFSDDEYFLDFEFDTPRRVKHIVLSEDSNACSERMQKAAVYAKWGPWLLKVGEAQSAGNKTIVRLGIGLFTPRAASWRIVVEQSKANPVLRYVGLYA